MIDWKNLKPLKRRKRPNDREKLAKLHEKRSGSHKGKNHGTGKRRSTEQRKKAGKRKFQQIKKARRDKQRADAVRAFWDGEREEYPE